MIRIARRFFRNAPRTEMSREEYNKLFWRSLGVLGVSGIGLGVYFQYQKNAIEQEKLSQSHQSSGTPKVGGPFCLVNHHGIPITDLDYRGKFMLIYFGYTFCPDICPEELEKMAEILEDMKANGLGDKIVPIFISCDPKRDSVESIGEYVQQFHPEFIGLTGTHAQIKKIAKSYRLYYSAPPRALDEDDADYLVDHSIFFYLMDPNGKYVCHFGRTDFAADVTERIKQVMKERGFQ